jgi:hypothetical protein
MPQNPDLEPQNNVQVQAQHNYNSPSHLFLVRLWAESNNEGDAVWCGKVQHVTKGKANQFKDWPTLIDLLMAMLSNAERVRHHGATGD